MESFKLKIVSQANTIIALLIFFAIVFLFVPIRIYLLPEKLWPLSPLILTIVFLLLLYFLFQKLARAYTEWTVNETGVQIHWLTHFAFNHKDEITISWQEIQSYKISYSVQYRTFKIFLNSGGKLIFYHDNWQAKDDFSELIAAFKSMYETKCS